MIALIRTLIVATALVTIVIRVRRGSTWGETLQFSAAWFALGLLGGTANGGSVTRGLGYGLWVSLVFTFLYRNAWFERLPPRPVVDPATVATYKRLAHVVLFAEGLALLVVALDAAGQSDTIASRVLIGLSIASWAIFVLLLMRSYLARRHRPANQPGDHG